LVLLIIVGSHTEIPWRDPLAPIVGALLFIVAVFHEVPRRTNPALAGFAIPRRNGFLAAAILATVSGFLPHPISGLLWIVTRILMVGPVVFGRFDRGVERPANNLEHLTDLLAALTTIVIGESFIRVVLTGSGRHLYHDRLSGVLCRVQHLERLLRRLRGRQDARHSTSTALVVDRPSPTSYRCDRGSCRPRCLRHAPPEQ
jgi:hypothetical protein